MIFLFRYEVKEDGDYQLCFNNHHSHFSTKTVYFEVFLDSDSDDYNEKWDDYDFLPELQYNDTIDQIKVFNFLLYFKIRICSLVFLFCQNFKEVIF